MGRVADLSDADRAELERALRKIEDVGIQVAAEQGVDVGAERDGRGRVPALTFRARGFLPAQNKPPKPAWDTDTPPRR
jgi:hypothetical protein